MEQNLNILWVLLAAILVFWMQAGFLLVESGFTRAKNTGNIIMKNLIDFVLGSLVYFFIGFALMFGVSAAGVIGTTGFFAPHLMTNVTQFFDLSPGTFLIFQTVFCATAATIVSGAMAERTKFSAYIIYTVAISVFIYPVVGHWIWGDGWLGGLGFVDFAGSTVVHSVGGWAALVGVKFLGARIGKYNKDGSPNAIPGHNLVLGALGVMILWMGWFGFNPGSLLEVNGEIGHVAMTTNLAAVCGAAVAMIVTWARYGKPDVSMTLNGVLAGLVGITAGCQVVTFYGAMLIGVVSGLVVAFGVDILDRVFHIDDPVGAIPVHCFCGVAGTLMVGLLANYAPGTEDAVVGLFYGGGATLLGIQALGVVSVAAWVLVTTTILFAAVKKFNGLRVSKEEEIDGLDLSEHGVQAYPDFISKI